jgi:hypothetical protein
MQRRDRETFHGERRDAERLDVDDLLQVLQHALDKHKRLFGNGQAMPLENIAV